MYNEAVKNEFLDTLPVNATKTNTINILESYSEVERKYNKDLGELSADELVEAMSGMGYVRPKRVMDVLRILKDYHRWYTQKRGQDPGSWDGIASKDIRLEDSLRGALVSSIEEINTLTALVPTDLCELAFPLVYFTWAGIELEESSMIKTRDVDISSDRVTVHVERLGSVVFDDYRAVKVIRDYANTNMVVKMRPSPQKYYKESTGFFLCRTFTENSTLKRNSITPAYLQISWREFRRQHELDGTPGLPTAGKMLLSGRMFRMSAEEKEKGSISDEFIVKEFNITLKRSRSLQQTISDIRNQYKIYKQTFLK